MNVDKHRGQTTPKGRSVGRGKTIARSTELPQQNSTAAVASAESHNLSNTITTFERLLSSSWVWLLVTVLSFLALSFHHLFYNRTWLDEALYLYKGYAALQGLYQMYAYGGMWYEYDPLAFIVPGISQLPFGPNLYVARLFSIAYSALILLSIYLLASRLSNVRAGIIAVWLLLGSMVTMRYFASGTPYAFTALALTVSVLILASEGRSPWREVLAIICVTLALVARRNMIVAWAIIILFAFLIQRTRRDEAIVVGSAIGSLGLILWPFSPEVFDTFLALPLISTIAAQLQIRSWGSPELAAVMEGVSTPWHADLALYYALRMLIIHLSVIGSATAAIVWGIARWRTSQTGWYGVWEHRLLVLIGMLFVSNVVVHVIGAQSYSSFTVIHHFVYFAPLGAVLGGIGLADILTPRTANIPIQQRFSGAGHTARVLTIALVLWFFPSWILISHYYHQWQNVASISVRQNFWITLVPILSGLLILLTILAALHWPTIRQRIAQRVWRVAGLLVAFGIISILLFQNATNTEMVLRKATHFWPLALLLVAWVIVNRTRPHLAPGFAIVLIALAPYNQYRLMDRSSLPELHRAAERFQALTTPDDRIFALTESYFFLLADRHPYPAPLNIEANLALAPLDDLVQKYNRWNITLTARWLNNTDVVILDEKYTNVIAPMYRGQSGSGMEILQVISTKVARDFVLLEESRDVPYSLIRVYRRTDGTKTAIDYLNEAIEQHPTMFDLYRLRGLAWLRAGDTEQALRDINYAIEHDPNQFTNYLQRADIAVQQGDAASAIADFNRAIVVNPNVAYIYVLRGGLYANQGNIDQAIADFNRALALDPNMSDTYVQRGRLVANQGRFDRAITDIQQAIELDPQNANAYNSLGEIYMFRREPDMAIPHLTRSLQLLANNPEAYLLRGQAYAQQGNSQQAMEDLQHALQQTNDPQMRDRIQQSIDALNPSDAVGE